MHTKESTYVISFDRVTGTVVMQWLGYSTSAQFREGTELMLQHIVDYRCGKVLADIKDMTLIGMEDQQWLEHDFLPRAFAAGFKALAIVNPESYFNKVAVENISKKVDAAKLTICFFETTQTAMNWLTQLP